MSPAEQKVLDRAFGDMSDVEVSPEASAIVERLLAQCYRCASDIDPDENSEVIDHRCYCESCLADFYCS